MRKYRPLTTMVIVSVDRTEEKSSGGIILDVSEREKNAKAEGTVLAIGPQAFGDFGDGESQIKVGDKVVFARYGGKELERNASGKESRLMKDLDILAEIVEE